VLLDALAHRRERPVTHGWSCELDRRRRHTPPRVGTPTSDVAQEFELRCRIRSRRASATRWVRAPRRRPPSQRASEPARTNVTRAKAAADPAEVDTKADVVFPPAASAYRCHRRELDHPTTKEPDDGADTSVPERDER
jgi:hypothetical protein